MLRVLASWLFYVFLTTAPPNFSAELTSVRATTPIEVLLLVVVFATVFTHLL